MIERHRSTSTFPRRGMTRARPLPFPGVEIHRGPPLHPDDVTTVRGIPVTSPSRTLIDCAEVTTIDELRELFARARDLGLLDPEALRAARARVDGVRR